MSDPIAKRILLVAALAVVAAAGPVAADERSPRPVPPSPSPPPVDGAAGSAVDQAIDDLGSPAFRERQGAELRLRRLGEDAVAGLVERAGHEDDLDVVERCRRLLDWIAADRRLAEVVASGVLWGDPAAWRAYPSHGPGRTEAVCRALAGARTWRSALAAASFLDFEDEADAILEAVGPLFAASPGIGRHHLIFLMAHAHPRGAEFCRRVARGELGADGTDRAEALLALALGGDASARVGARRFLSPSPAFVGAGHRIPDLETYLAEVEDPAVRERLVAYRAFELLIGRPYFHLMEFLFRSRGGLGPSPLRRLPFARPDDEAGRARALVDGLELFGHLFPEHPGSDDAALLAAEACLGPLDDPIAAAVWLLRGRPAPDGDERGRIASRLLGLLYVDLSVRQLDRLAIVIGRSPGRDRVAYARLLARARSGRPEEALGLLARYDPTGEADALWRRPDARRQFDLWGEWVVRRRRLAAAAAPDKPAALYQVAALFYHERSILRPVELADTASDWSVAFSNHDPGDGPEAEERRLEWLLDSHHLARSASLFARLRQAYPDAPNLDKALFSEGLCYHKMKDERAFQSCRWFLGSVGRPVQVEQLTRRHVELFQELLRRCPDSNLADDAARSIEYQIRVGNHRPDR